MISFLKRGVTSECLKANGKLPVESERLIIWAITGRRTDAQSFRREVGIGSNSHCLLGSEFKSSKTSASGRMENLKRRLGERGRMDRSGR